MRIRPAATLSLLPALLAGFVLLLALPGQAAAAKPCWERVIDDWLANGTITGTYKVSCYQQALKHVPEDMRDYTNVTDAIDAAMHGRSPRDRREQQRRHRHRHWHGSVEPAVPPQAVTGQGEKPRKLQVVPPRSYYRRAIDNLGTTSADSVPIPLLVLASLGGLLLLSAAGLAGAKRYKAIRARPKPPR